MNELENIKDTLHKLIENCEQQLVDSLGMHSYKSSSGFTPGQIYSYAGAKDYVTTLSLKMVPSLLENTAVNLPSFLNIL